MTVANMDQRPTKAEKITGKLSSPNEINQELPPNQNGGSERRIRKKCLGCGFPSENSDYCPNCKINRGEVHEQSPGTIKLHELTGIITNKESYKVYNKTSDYLDNQCYKLQVILENEKEQTTLFVYPNLVPPQIFQTIEQTQYIDKRYLFFCEKKPKRWVLHNWRELNPSEKLENHEQEK